MPWWRWLLIAVVLAAMAGVFYRHGANACQETVAPNSSVVETCRPIAVTDPPMVAGGVLIVLLALPLVAEISLFGFSLKSRLAKAERELTATAQAQQVLVDRVNDIQLSIGATARADVHFHVGGPTELEQLKPKLQADVAAYVAGAEISGEPETPISRLTDADVAQRYELIRRWEQINRHVQVGPSLTAIAGYAPLLNDAEADRFKSLFAEELDAVRRVRNSVAHDAPIDPTSVTEALDIAQTLLDVLQRKGS